MEKQYSCVLPNDKESYSVTVLMIFNRSCNLYWRQSLECSVLIITTDVLFSEERPLPLADTVVVIAVSSKRPLFRQTSQLFQQ